MSKLDISFELELDDKEKELIEDTLEIDNTDFNKTASLLAKSSFIEYLKMLTENGIPSRAADVKELRLYIMLKNYYVDYIPTEVELARVFQITVSQARTLLKNTMSKYRFSLKTHLYKTIKTTLNENYRNDDDNYIYTIKSDYLKDEINETIKHKKPNLNKLINNGSYGEYKCDNDTHKFLKEEYSLC